MHKEAQSWKKESLDKKHKGHISTYFRTIVSWSFAKAFVAIHYGVVHNLSIGQYKATVSCKISQISQTLQPRKLGNSGSIFHNDQKFTPCNMSNSKAYSRCCEDLLIIFSRNVFWGATRPLRPPAMSMPSHSQSWNQMFPRNGKKKDKTYLLALDYSTRVLSSDLSVPRAPTREPHSREMPKESPRTSLRSRRVSSVCVDVCVRMWAKGKLHWLQGTAVEPLLLPQQRCLRGTVVAAGTQAALKPPEEAESKKLSFASVYITVEAVEAYAGNTCTVAHFRPRYDRAYKAHICMNTFCVRVSYLEYAWEARAMDM